MNEKGGKKTQTNDPSKEFKPGFGLEVTAYHPLQPHGLKVQLGNAFLSVKADPVSPESKSKSQKRVSSLYVHTLSCFY